MKSRLIILVGPPLSGKDTYLNTIGYPSFTIVSRDDIMMSLSNTSNYTDSFKMVNQKLVDRKLNDILQESIYHQKDTIINMTNLTKKSRNKHLSKFDSDKYEKIAIVFSRLPLEEYKSRNIKRKIEQDKFIPESVIEDMLNRWEDVTIDEGFDKIINL